MDFIQKEGINMEYFGQCIDYKSSTATIQMAARIVYNCAESNDLIYLSIDHLIYSLCGQKFSVLGKQ